MNERPKTSRHPFHPSHQGQVSTEDAARMSFADTHPQDEERPVLEPAAKPEPASPLWRRWIDNDASAALVVLLILLYLASRYL